MKFSLQTKIGSVLCVGAMGIVLAGCGGTKAQTLGVAPVGETTTTTQELTAVPAKQTVVVKGEMIEKCPVAGCWFVLKDKSGTVRVDTKGAGFVVTDVPLHTTVTVGGTVKAGNQPTVIATGVSY